MFGREHGSKIGSGGTNSSIAADISRRQRQKLFALEKIDISKDPYIMKNHLGTYDCKLCMTTHPNEGNYLAHTQGKKHQLGIARRAAREAQANPMVSQVPKTSVKVKSKPDKPKIGRPMYRYIKQFDPETQQRSLLFIVEYPEIEEGLQPRTRVMSAFEQKIEKVPDANYQYLIFAAEPYNNIAFKIPNIEIEREIDPSSGKVKFWTNWDKETNVFMLQLYFKDSPNDIREREEREKIRRERELKDAEKFMAQCEFANKEI